MFYPFAVFSNKRVWLITSLLTLYLFLVNLMACDLVIPIENDNLAVVKMTPALQLSCGKESYKIKVVVLKTLEHTFVFIVINSGQCNAV